MTSRTHENGSCMKSVRSCELNLCGSEYRPMAGCCEDGNKPSGSLEAYNFLTR